MEKPTAAGFPIPPFFLFVFRQELIYVLQVFSYFVLIIDFFIYTLVVSVVMYGIGDVKTCAQPQMFAQSKEKGF